jgi:hypothetical protein
MLHYTNLNVITYHPKNIVHTTLTLFKIKQYDKINISLIQINIIVWIIQTNISSHFK